MDNSFKNQLLRFTTAGSVDDGKSTLIGRLLYDSKALFDDQIDQIQRTSEQKGMENIDLALFTDGLRDEREQGITIDVAYRYFTTPKRKFIIADTPGHIQYTRNMVTGASTANVALILIDARKGVVEQTKRHSYIANLLRIPHILVCINKMDLVGYDQEVFDDIVKNYQEIIDPKGKKDFHFIPISALQGDNVVHSSEQMPWYSGSSLLHLLETIDIQEDINQLDLRLPVQTVIRPQKEAFHDFRGYSGRIASGTLKVGDKIKVLPSGLSSEVKEIWVGDQQKNEAHAPLSVTITLQDDIDIARGDLLVHEADQLASSNELTMKLCWLDNEALKPRAKYILKHTTAEYRCMIKQVDFKVNINDYCELVTSEPLQANDIAQVVLKTSNPLYYDAFSKSKINGSVILIDEASFATVAAGMIE